MSTPAPSLAAAPNASRLTRLALSVLVPAVIVLATVAPKAHALGLFRLPTPHPHWPDLGLIARAAPAVQLHLATVLVALAIGIVLLLGVKGRTMHRTLGWVWVVAMMTAAVSSLFIRMLNHGSLSFIHLLSGWTIVSLLFF